MIDRSHITFPQELPVSQRTNDICAAINEHQVIIVAGETGSGKTTQLPKMCLTAGRAQTGLIGHTQPRRIAARAVAARIAQELKTTVGAGVSYKIRFSDKTSENTLIKLMTDGILLAEIQTDRLLKKYDTLIIDEAHERSLNIDFILGYLKWLLPKRPDLKIIITSATIDAQRFSRYFNHAPLIEVSGRAYPIELYYRPLNERQQDGGKSRLNAICQAVEEAYQRTTGDILVFMTGERDIRDTEQALHQQGLAHTEIIPLFSRLNVQQQNKIFMPAIGRRIVLATNVAETSLTVPNIHVVIDPGDARISRYNYRNKVQHLLIEPISQASANQRKGRCGRVANGLCIRLYSEEDFLSRPEFTEPEILRTNLAAVILRMADFRLGDILHFSFLEPPDKRWVRDGYKLLLELEAIDHQHCLTDIGKKLARWPIEPRFGRMLLAGAQTGCIAEILIIVSALSTQDPRVRDIENRAKADNKQQLWHDEHSDFLLYVNIWRDYHRQAAHLSRNKLEHYCEEHYLSAKKMREWIEIYQQLHTLLTEQGVKFNEQPADYSSIHCALLTGLLSFIANKYEKSDYLAAHQLKIRIFPASACFKKSPPWLMAASFINTGMLYAQCVATIESQWIEHTAKHLLKCSYSEPHWEKNKGFVTAFARATLYGLIIYTQRRINYGPIDPVLSREIFIRHALVMGELTTHATFLKHNQTIVSDVEKLEHKTRRRDLLVDEQWRYEFYDTHIPVGIYSKPLLEQWYFEQSLINPQLLFFREEDLLQKADILESTHQFPDALAVNDQPLQLLYQFDPGKPSDGVTAVIPQLLLHQLPRYRWQWLVPGLLEEKILALLKSLPKSLRRSLMPLPELASACYQKLAQLTDDTPLITALISVIADLKKITILPADWDETKLPDYLHMHFSIIDENNTIIEQGADLAALQLEGKTPGHQPDVLTQYDRAGITEWDIDELPVVIDIMVGKINVKRYLAFVDEITSVALKGFEKESVADFQHYFGVRRFIFLSLHKEMKYLIKQVSDWSMLGLQFSSVSTVDELKNDVLLATIQVAFLMEQPLLRSKQDYVICLQNGKSQLVTAFQKIIHLARTILKDYYQIQKELRHVDKTVHADITQQLKGLIFKGFLSATAYDWLKRYPIYFQGILHRLAKPNKGVEYIDPLHIHMQRYQQLAQQFISQHISLSADLLTYRWFIEEYRISLFAQQLKTKAPISGARLDKMWVDLKKELR